ncbi:MAG: hypothetical protein R3E13_06610 [Alphaproteobacteria bacterium]
MIKTTALSLLILSTLALTGCVDRAAADQRLVKACKAAILAFSDEGDKIEAVTSEKIHDHAKLGAGFRELVLDVTVTDGFHPRDESHSCIFQEEFSFGRMAHRASIYQLNFAGRIIGQENYRIIGSIEDMQKLTEAVDSALR